MMTRRGKVLVLMAAGGLCAVVLFLALRTGAPKGVQVLQISFTPGTVREVAAVFRRGGMAFVNDGFVVWTEGEEWRLLRGVKGLPPYGPPGALALQLANGEVVESSLMNSILSIEPELGRLSRVGPDSEDAHEYFIYVAQNGNARSYRVSEAAIHLSSPELATWLGQIASFMGASGG